VLCEDATAAANWRAQDSIDRWLKDRNLIGIAGVDTRRLVRPRTNRKFISEGRRSIAASPPASFLL
jgi:carbamoylphosphate synthase small subunit